MRMHWAHAVPGETEASPASNAAIQHGLDALLLLVPIRPTGTKCFQG